MESFYANRPYLACGAPWRRLAPLLGEVPIGISDRSASSPALGDKCARVSRRARRRCAIWLQAPPPFTDVWVTLNAGSLAGQSAGIAAQSGASVDWGHRGQDVEVYCTGGVRGQWVARVFGSSRRGRLRCTRCRKPSRPKAKKLEAAKAAPKKEREKKKDREGAEPSGLWGCGQWPSP